VLLNESKLKYAADSPIKKLIQISSEVSEMNYLGRMTLSPFVRAYIVPFCKNKKIKKKQAIISKLCSTYFY